jgi:hypothetical protein
MDPEAQRQYLLKDAEELSRKLDKATASWPRKMKGGIFKLFGKEVSSSMVGVEH